MKTHPCKNFFMSKTASSKYRNMKTITALTLSFLGLNLSNAANLSVGNIIVERVGDGVATLGSGATGVALLEYSTSGTAIQTITFPSTGSNQLTEAGSGSSAGYVNSYNGLVAVTGYNSSSGTASVASQNTKVTSILDNSGSVVNRTVYPTGGPAGAPPSPFSGSNIRSAIATSSSTFYASGSSSGSPSTQGVWYNNGTSFTQLASANTRNIEIYNNQLFYSTSAGVFRLGNGLPTTAVTTPTQVISVSGGSVYGFLMFDTNADSLLDTAYTADDGTSAGKGLSKWTSVDGNSWTQSWSLLINASNALQATAATGFSGFRGLSGTYENGVASLFAISSTETSNNRLLKILDNGAAPTSATTIATSGANYAFRGVDIMTVPEPSSSMLMVVGMVALVAVRAVRRSRGNS